MDKITFIDIEGIGGEIQTHAVIDRGNNEFTSMTKEYFDSIQANSTPSVPSDPVSNK